METTLKIYLSNGNFNLVKFSDIIDIKEIIHLVTSHLSDRPLPLEHAYAIRLCHASMSEMYWLPADMTMSEVLEKYSLQHVSDEWRYELRIRYIPSNLHDLLEKDWITFHYFFDQVRNDYLKIKNEIDRELAIEVCCAEIRRFFKDMTHFALDKKSNFEYLEKDVGLHKFLPSSVILGNKPKTLRKMIQVHFKKYSSLSEVDCMLKVFDLVHRVLKYDREYFDCALGVGWSVPIELVVGPTVGISYIADRMGQLTFVANFNCIQNIELIKSEAEPNSKVVLHLKIAGATEVFNMSFSSLSVAESMASLIDGYSQLANKKCASVQNRKDCQVVQYSTVLKQNNEDILDIKKEEDYAEIVDEDYSTLATKEYELNRSHIKLYDIIGEGQFGDVYKGKYKNEENQLIEVAVKICKVENEESFSEKFLGEACTLK